MDNSHSDALVFFGATGDLAFKKIFPALHAMAKRGHLEVPVIGVGRSDWTADQLRARARASLEQSGEVAPAACEKLCRFRSYLVVFSVSAAASPAFDINDVWRYFNHEKCV